MMRFLCTTFCVLAASGTQIVSDEEAGTKRTAKSDVSAGERRIVVVVSTKNAIESMTLAELGRIYLRKTTVWPDGVAITVFERPVGNRIRQDFSRKVLQKTPEALREYWMNLQLTRGLSPPKVLRSPNLVKRYLSRVKGGIAYLYEDEIDDTVKVVEISRQKN
jgi:ABC-type phosphate transport system substrate-binding protein